ncbi:hypothetical protein [Oceanobacter kriegii]|uniref:hypothetical protein n=1 Tax=Oceanobacter kriegii TaxID=64972 RepID=UPI00040DA80E|nr:hypothetical protein [Oceanobacter kriegii]
MDWKAAARQGQQAFLEHQYLQALGHHRQALQLALEGFEALAPLDMDGAIASVVVSYINMAECNALLQQRGEFHRCLTRAENFIADLSEQQTLNGQRACHRAGLMLRQETLTLLRQFEDLPADAALSPSAAASLSGGADKTRSTSPSPKGFH